MKYEIVKVQNIKIAKIFAYFYFILGSFLSFIASILIIIEGHDLVLILPTLLIPLLEFIIGGLLGFLISVFYNFFANKYGGVIVELKHLK